jgi:cysteine desulfurase
MLNTIKKIFIKKQKRIYFDNASATDFSEIRKKSILENLKYFANSSSIHIEGELSKKVLSESREKVARFIRAKKNEVFFGSSTTELNNIYIKGIILPHLFSYFKKSASLNHFLLEDKIPETAKEIYKTLQNSKPHIITSLAEHSSILEICKYLENLGAEVTYLKPNKIGKVLVEDILKNVKSNTKLICLSLVNSETGILQDIRGLCVEIKSSPALLSQGGDRTFPKVFIDATQSIKYLGADVGSLLCDAMTFGGNKFGSIPGAAVLFIKQNAVEKSPFETLIHGGGQEEGLRAGTENLLAIKTLADNLESIKSNRDKNNAYISNLKAYTIEQLQKNFSEMELEIFGDIKIKKNKEGNIYFDNSSPQILLIRLAGMLGEELLLRLDAKGISVSTATACSILDGAGSNFLKSQGEFEKAKETIRISFSEKNTKEEIDYFIKVLSEIKEKYL